MTSKEFDKLIKAFVIDYHNKTMQEAVETREDEAQPGRQQLPPYMIDAIQKVDSCPLPCEVIQPNQRNFENMVHRVIIALRAEYPEIEEISFFLFDDEAGAAIAGGIDGIFQPLYPLRPVIGACESVFSEDGEPGYQAFLLLHEIAHSIQPQETAVAGSLLHDDLFHAILSQLITLYNDRYGEQVYDWDLVRNDGDEKPLLKH